MKRNLILSLLMSVSVLLNAQDYSDVAILINSNSTESITVGEYFQSAHDIPDNKVFYISMPLTELIDSIDMVPILEEIQTKLDSLTSVETINYIVTTIGCPRLVVEQKFLEIDYSFENIIATFSYGGFETNTYKDSTDKFSYEKYGFYLVSRLEASDVEKTLLLIDRGGFQSIDDSNNNFILDIFQPFNEPDSTLYSVFLQWISTIASDLGSFNLNTTKDADLTNYTGAFEGFGYFLITFAEVDTGVPIEDVSGISGLSIFVSSYSAQKSSDKLNVFHFLDANCFGGVGAYRLFYVATFDLQPTFHKNFYDLNKGLNLAEAYYSATSFFLGSYTLFGDPKSQLTEINVTPSSLVDIPNEKQLKIYPNPTNDFINIDLPENMRDINIVLMSSMGKIIFTENIQSQKTIKKNLAELETGHYFFKIQSESINQTIPFFKK